MAEASVTIDVVCPDAAAISSIMYEIAGHFGKLGHLYGKLAEMAEKQAALSPDEVNEENEAGRKAERI